MNTKPWMAASLLLMIAACDNDGGDDGGGGSGAGDNCGEAIAMSVTGELTPMYDWDAEGDDDGVYSLSIIRVENADYISEHSTECAPSAGDTTVDERCEIAYSRVSSPDPSDPETPRNLVMPPVMHGDLSSSEIPPEVSALTQENPLEMGVEYYASVV